MHPESVFDAIANDDLQAIKKLLKCNTIDAHILTSALIKAVHNRDILLCLITTGGANVNTAQASDGMTVLMAAASEGLLETVQLLVAVAGANVGLRNPDGWSASHFAAMNQHREVLRYLIRVGGADVSDGSALMAVVSNGEYDTSVERIVDTLLDAGSDVNARGRDERTVLMEAVIQALLRRLLAAGADVDAVDSFGQSAIDYATAPD